MRNLDHIVNPVEPATPSLDAIPESVESIFGNWWHTQVINGVAHVHIFGEVGCTRPWKEMLHEVCGAKDIKLFIDSVGGNSIAGINLFRELTGRVSETTITGRCFSAALTIALAGKKIRMERQARILCHAPHSWIYADAEQMAFQSKYLAGVAAYLKKIIMERCELSETVVAGWLNGVDVYFSAEQAVAYGLADEIYDAPKPAVLVAPTTIGATVSAMKKLPTFTEGESLMNDILFSIGRITVRNRANFIRELCAWAAYNTDEEPEIL